MDRGSSDGDSAAPKLSDCAIDQGVADLAVQQALGGLFFDIGTWEALAKALERALAASQSHSPAEVRDRAQAGRSAVPSDQ